MRRRDLHSRLHSWQGGRWMPALDVNTFKVDERDPVDLIAFVTAFSQKLMYPGEVGGAGSWEPFFIGATKKTLIPGDISFLIAQIASVDAKREHLEVVGLGAPDNPDLLDKIYDALARLDNWCQIITLASSNKPKNSVEQDVAAMLQSLIAGNYTFATSSLPELVAYLEHDPQFAAPWARIIKSRGQLLSDIWRPKSLDDSQTNANHDALDIYGLVNRTTQVISEQAATYLDRSLIQPDHTPHAALLLAFLQLYEKVQADLNKMTRRHLNFYYRQILQLSERPSSPDKAHVYFELSPQAAPFTLVRGAQLNGGTDATGAPILFALDDDLQLDQASVARVASLYIEREPEDGAIISILARPVANSQDGFGAKLIDPDAGWSPFGPAENTVALSPANAMYAQVGLLIRSPCLLLRAGSRGLVVTLQFAAGASLKDGVDSYVAAARRQMTDPTSRRTRDEQIVASAFCLALEGTGDDGPIAAAVDLSKLADGQIAFMATLALDAPPLAPPAGSDGQTGLPALRITMARADDARVFAYSYFAGLALKSVLLDVSVAGLAPLILQTAAGLVDASKPFWPFGPLAPLGATLIFSHPDLFGKPIDTLTLNLQWSGLPVPPDSLESVYSAYGSGLTDDSFRGCLSVLSNYAWTPIATISSAPDAPASFPLFDVDSNGVVPTASRSFSFATNAAFAPLDQAALVYNATCKTGFFRLQLTDPSIGFGQQVYPQLLTSTMIANGRAAAWEQQQPMPRAPINPMLASISVDYTAHVELVLQGPSAGVDPARDEGIYRFGPFGMRTEIVDFTAFPTWPDNGYLLIGIADLDSSRGVSLLFYAEANAADFSVTLRDETKPDDAAPAVELRYFSGLNWKDLPANAVTKDTTVGLSRSGVIGLQFPSDASRFPAPDAGDLTWLQIAVTRPERYGRIIDIRCQGATATRMSPLGPNVAAPFLPANAINALVQKNPKVQLVGQPFATEGGRLAEDDRQFQIRVSERLGHKQRAILPRDYELLILDRFPNIGDAKCLTREEAKCFGVEAGEVVIVVAPLRVADADNLEPCVPEYLLREIGEFLMEICPASVDKIIVLNPEYEPIRISASLDFAVGDRAQFLNRVQQTADDFIAPWRNDYTQPLAIGTGQVDLSALRAALEDLSFVQEVSALSMVQFYNDPAPQSPGARGQMSIIRIHDTARPSFGQSVLTTWWPWSVLSPAPDHQFQLLDGPTGIGVLGLEDDFVVASNAGDFYLPPQRAGIGNMAIGLDMLVQTGIDHLAIEDDLFVG
jgi:hypothetical protein